MPNIVHSFAVRIIVVIIQLAKLGLDERPTRGLPLDPLRLRRVPPYPDLRNLGGRRLVPARFRYTPTSCDHDDCDALATAATAGSKEAAATRSSTLRRNSSGYRLGTDTAPSVEVVTRVEQTDSGRPGVHHSGRTRRFNPCWFDAAPTCASSPCTPTEWPRAGDDQRAVKEPKPRGVPPR